MDSEQDVVLIGQRSDIIDTKEKAKRKRAQNAMAARINRERKKQYVEMLERKLQAKDALISRLKLKIVELEERSLQDLEFYIDLNKEAVDFTPNEEMLAEFPLLEIQ